MRITPHPDYIIDGMIGSNHPVATYSNDWQIVTYIVKEVETP